jgi:hypothetical protein
MTRGFRDFGGVFTRRQYMTRRLLLDGVDMWAAIELVSSIAMAHPDWDMDERHTWSEWEAMKG